MPPIWVRQPRDFDAELFRRVFLASPLPLRASLFHARKNVHRHGNRAGRISAHRCNPRVPDENIFNRAVVLRALICAFNQQANAGAGRHAIKHAGENFT